MNYNDQRFRHKARRIAFPLYNFDCKLEKLRLDENTVIQELGEDSWYKPYLDKIEAGSKFYLTHEMEVLLDDPILEKLDDARPYFERGQSILRLFKPDLVYSSIYFVYLGYDDMKYAKSRVFHHYIPWGQWRPYVLQDKQIDRLKTFWHKYRNIDPDDFALKRFWHGDIMPYDLDKLVDYTIALEHLFVPDGKVGEVGYKLKVRGAYMLAQIPYLQAYQAYEDLSTLYKIRNYMVHGGRKKKEVAKILDDPGQCKEFIYRTREYVMYAIRIFYELGLLKNREGRKKYLQGKVDRCLCHPQEDLV